jgi:hypothetical protein
MGFASILQGGALQDRYRALLLVRHPVGELKVGGATAGGLASEQLTLSRVETKPLAGLLRERRLSAYQFEARELRPGRAYTFRFRDGASTDVPLETYTLPQRLPQDGVTVAVGSCFFDGFDMSARIDAVLRQPWLGHRPLLQLWNGDNLYVDVPSFGFNTPNRPYVQTLERYLRYFDGTAYMRARAVTPNYTTYDDHELWNNFPEPQIHLSRDDDALRLGYTMAGWACLDLFQAWLNPPPRPELFPPLQDPSRPARSFQLDLPPLSIFFADLRTNRDRQRPNARMMARRDLAALELWAATLRGPGVLVTSQPLWMAKGDKVDYNPPDFAAEYAAIWRALRDAPFDVMVVSGDVHHSRILKLSFADAPERAVYEVVSSPASHIPTTVTTVLPSTLFAQDRARIALPGAVENSGQRLKPSYYFGTSAQNTLGFLGLRPGADESVQVSAIFVDHGDKRGPRAAPCEPYPMPFAWRRYATCDSDGPLFTLRRRARP